MRLWDVNTGEQLGCMEHGCPVKWLTLTDNGSLAVSAGGNRSVRVWNLEDCSLYSELPAQQVRGGWVCGGWVGGGHFVCGWHVW